MYYGWSHEQGRMQMMDLPSYLDSFRFGYERAIEDLQGQLTNLAQSMMPGGAPATAWTQYQAPVGQPGRREHGHPHHHHGEDCGCHDHEHRHHHDHDHECGCGGCRECGHDDCHCTCCIVDADYVVYARCGERRVVPIQIDNDTRRERENVTIDVSDVRTSGGRQLPWRVAVLPRSPITLPACSTTEIDVRVEIVCGDEDKNPDQPKPTPRKAAGRAEQQEARQEIEFVDVDNCEVGYVTIRVEGCLVRPIVVAVAVLPRDCDAYHTGCSCSCCC
jgi:hypothetical protein